MTTVGRFNPNHAAPGGATGGQFTSGGSGGSGGSGSKGATGAKPSAHQQHVAHEQHLKYLANHPGTPDARAHQKAALLEAAKADRAKAAQLGKQLKGLEQQQAKAAQAARHAKAVVAAAKGGAVQRRTAAHKAAVTHKKHASLKQQISGLETQISDLNDKAHALEAQAAKLLWPRPAPATCGRLSGCTSTGCTARAPPRSAGVRAAITTAA